MKPAWVVGSGRWTASAREAEPVAALLPRAALRRCTFLTKLTAEVLGQAVAGADAASVMTVHAGAHGEVNTLAALLEMLHTDGVYSPTRFHNSVHNTASGQLAISLGNRAFTTALAAGPDTVAMALLEALCLLDDRGGEVIVVFADEAPVASLGLSPFDSFGAAVRLSAAAPADGGALRVVGLQRGEAAAQALPPGLEGNPVAPALWLVEAVRERRAGPVALSLAPGGWVLQLEAP